MQTSQALSRRSIILGAAVTLAAVTGAQGNPFYDGDLTPDGRNPALFPPAASPIDFPVIPADMSRIPHQFHRQLVAYDGFEETGTIVVDPEQRFLFHVLEGGSAIRYGVGVGRAGFAWSGDAVVGMKRRWPRWLPPIEMTQRDIKAAVWLNGMPGGPENPLGARALYLHADNVDTLYRIHGTNEPHSIGKAMSSGCIRMLNQDVAELFDQVPVGTRVVVRGADQDLLADQLL
jgi:lipoprotein-anchoring transpeptidase ErfK/SrfK